VDAASRVYVWPQPTSDIQLTVCVNQACDGQRQVLILDTDGRFAGLGASAGNATAPNPVTIFGRAEAIYSAETGNYVPPAMLTRSNSSVLAVADIAGGGQGIARITDGGGYGGVAPCAVQTTWNAWRCASNSAAKPFELTHRMLVVESLDADTETRRLVPVAILSTGSALLADPTLQVN
jgi:hypothetical protein